MTALDQLRKLILNSKGKLIDPLLHDGLMLLLKEVDDTHQAEIRRLAEEKANKV